MKNVLLLVLWTLIAIAAAVYGQPLITLAIGVCAATERYAQWRLRRTTKSATGESSISQAFAASEDGPESRRHDWMKLA